MFVPTRITTPQEASRNSLVLIFCSLFSPKFGNWPGSVENIVADSSFGKPPFETDILLEFKLILLLRPILVKNRENLKNSRCLTVKDRLL